MKRLKSNKVALLDDVLFEGGTHQKIAERLKQRGIHVEKVLTGIAIHDGIERLAKEGILVESLLCYDQVVDEICERDFVAGVPLSGRTVVTRSGKVEGAPYFKPFGKPDKWASIPGDHVQDFSDFCLGQSIAMWALIERLSNKTVSTKAVPKPVFGLKPNESMSKALKGARNSR